MNERFLCVFQKNLGHIRRGLHLSRFQLAVLAGTSAGYIARLERGKAKLDRLHYNAIMHALEVNMTFQRKNHIH